MSESPPLEVGPFYVIRPNPWADMNEWRVAATFPGKPEAIEFSLKLPPTLTAWILPAARAVDEFPDAVAAFDRIDPNHPTYCAKCNYDEHMCGGCGTPTSHGQPDCGQRCTD